MTTFTPTTAAETLDAVRWAVSEESPVEILGHGSKRGIGRPAQTAHAIDLSLLTGVTLYEPEELVLSARAGTPIAEIEALVKASGQELAFEPMDYGPLLGGEPGRGTIGGVLAANLSGPRRLKAGAARDHILGIHAVSGRGEAFKSGGRVVKNVTGYDLSKAMAGSWGTLAVLTDVTFKVLPAAETETTVALRRLTDEQAAIAMAAALGSSAEVSGAAHLPEMIAARVLAGSLNSAPATFLRVEGFGPSVAYRVAMLKDLFGAGVEIEEIGAESSRALWRQIRDVAPF
ncbi:MAG: FAD-binding protein, partial [Mesorhizobium sp.]|nr:FAD-binding protein [Mesorhizobium sp.]